MNEVTSGSSIPGEAGRVLRERQPEGGFPSAGLVRFAEFQANLWTGEVFRHKQKIALQEKPFQILKALLERRGQMVTREELRRILWSSDVFVNFEGGLKTAISKLRRALGDSAERPRLVETLPRRGYRLVAPVEGAGGSAPAEVVPATRLKMVVLPFENLSGDPSQEHFSDGVTQEVISHLGRLHPGRLGVIARTFAMRYKRTGKSLERIGRELNVDHVLEGSVRRAGRRVRITAQLVHVGDPAPVWMESYDHNLGDVLGLQSEVAAAIGRGIRGALRLYE